MIRKLTAWAKSAATAFLVGTSTVEADTPVRFDSKLIIVEGVCVVQDPQGKLSRQLPDSEESQYPVIKVSGDVRWREFSDLLERSNNVDFSALFVSEKFKVPYSSGGYEKFPWKSKAKARNAGERPPIFYQNENIVFVGIEIDSAGVVRAGGVKVDWKHFLKAFKEQEVTLVVGCQDDVRLASVLSLIAVALDDNESKVAGFVFSK